jgi:hypothetical protein
MGQIDQDAVYEKSSIINVPSGSKLGEALRNKSANV